MDELILNIQDDKQAELLKAVASNKDGLGDIVSRIVSDTAYSTICKTAYKDTDVAGAVQALIAEPELAGSVSVLKAGKMDEEEKETMKQKEKEMEDEMDKAKMDETLKKACRTALKALNGVKDRMPEEVMKKLMSKAGYGYAPPDEMKKAGKKDEDLGYTVKKDGSGLEFDDTVPDSVRPGLEQLWKANKVAAEEAAELKKSLESERTLLVKERETRLRREYINKAAAFNTLSMKPDEFGVILMKAADTLDEADYLELERVLRAADEGLKNLFKQVGTDIDNGGGEESAVVKLEKAAKQIAKRDGISSEQAFVKALDEHPDLARQERTERATH